MTALDSVFVEGYKSFRSVEVRLGAVNVLIGANGAGKSNLLGLFGLLADLADRRLQLHVARRGGADAILHFGRKRTRALHLVLQFGTHAYSAALMPAAGDTLVFQTELVLSEDEQVASLRQAVRLADELAAGGSGHKETRIGDDEIAVTALSVDPVLTKPALAAMRSWRQFHFHDTSPSSPVKQKHRVDDNRALRVDGANLAPFLYALQKTATGAYRRIVEAVRTVAPFFDDFLLEPDVLNSEVIQLAWRHRSDDALFTADALSDGTLRFICLATLLLQPELPSLIVIDEPELGLHPFAITQLVSLIRAASAKAQVLLATQSVTLLDQFDASEVLVAEHHDGESKIERLDEAALAKWLEAYSLGELWLKNVLGGRPE